jgi:hypothetical protein
MSLTTIARRRLLIRPPLTRHTSTTRPSPTSNAASSSTQLPPEKMRALISLYHQSKDFISPANLSDKIDEVFAKDFYANSTSFAGYWNLVGMLMERNNSPVIGSPHTRDQLQPHRWFVGPAAKREQMVFNALYGVDEDMPGLETLLDEEGKIRENTEVNEAAKRSS